jgi:hypothetical protein
MCVLIFSTTFVWNTSHSKKNWARLDQKRVLVFIYSACYWSSYTVPVIGLHMQCLLLVFICSACYWSSYTVPVIGLHIQCLLLVFIYSACYWSSYTVPVIGLHIQCLLLIFIYSACYWSSCTVPVIGLHVECLLLVFIYSTRHSFPILMKLEFSRHIFEKYSNTEFRENPSSENWVVPCGRMDRATWRS